MAGTREPLSRDLIVETTRRLIIESGLDAVSLRGVAGALGVTAPALYAYVDDKRDLLQAVAEQEFAALLARFDEVRDADPAARLRGYCRAYLDHARANPELYEVMFVFPPELTSTVGAGDELAMATKTFTLPASAIAEAIEQGTFRAMDPVQAALVAWTAIHGAAHVLRLGFGFDATSEDAFIDNMIDTVMRGLRA